MTFTVSPGQVTGFVGPNGAGKSTTMRIILGLDAADAGTATVGGRPLRWSGVDRFLLVEGRATERVSWFDGVPLFLAMLSRPACWPAFWRSGVARTMLSPRDRRPANM